MAKYTGNLRFADDVVLYAQYENGDSAQLVAAIVDETTGDIVIAADSDNNDDGGEDDGGLS